MVQAASTALREQVRQIDVEAPRFIGEIGRDPDRQPLGVWRAGSAVGMQPGELALAFDNLGVGGEDLRKRAVQADADVIHKLGKLHHQSPGRTHDEFGALFRLLLGVGFVQLGGDINFGSGFNTITLPAFTNLGTSDFFRIINGGTGNSGAQISGITVTSIAAVPGPIVDAGLPGLMAASAGLLLLAQRRRKAQASA